MMPLTKFWLEINKQNIHKINAKFYQNIYFYYIKKAFYISIIQLIVTMNRFIYANEHCYFFSVYLAIIIILVFFL